MCLRAVLCNGGTDILEGHLLKKQVYSIYLDLTDALQSYHAITKPVAGVIGTLIAQNTYVPENCWENCDMHAYLT